MDKETQNIMELQRYLDGDPTVQHLSRALTIFRAEVLYEDGQLDTIYLPDTEIRFQHSYNNDLTIPDFRPPYYNSFWFTKQEFKYGNGCLYVSGVRHDNPKCWYRISIK